MSRKDKVSLAVWGAWFAAFVALEMTPALWAIALFLACMIAANALTVMGRSARNGAILEADEE